MQWLRDDEKGHRVRAQQQQLVSAKEMQETLMVVCSAATFGPVRILATAAGLL